MKLYNSSFPASEHVLYMGWVCEGILNHNLPWQNWKPKFIALKGTDIYMFDTPPVSVLVGIVQVLIIIITVPPQTAVVLKLYSAPEVL